MTRILVAASAVVLAAFVAFSSYINSVQRSVTTASIEANIQSSGEQAARSLANWMNVNPLIVRLVFVAGTVFGFGSFILIYLAIALLAD